MVKKNLLLIQEDGKRQYLRMFLLGFFTLLVVLLPIVIFNKGYFIYYGDFNSQQIPFYHLAHDAVRSGQLGWNWQTDLGANFIGSYSFYLLGSPFFWLTIPFPSGAVPYLIPWLLCLKHGMATMTGYAYIRRFVRSPRAAAIGAMLYAFSGFQAYNIFFNHFQDVTAFFPLLLIALEERVNNNRRGVFALAVALMAMLNYFFFAGQVVFVLVYFLFRCTCKDFHITRRKFFSIALESVIGVLLSAVLLLPSCLTILENNRVTERLYGMNMVAYSDRTRIIRIIQSFFMIPDVPARPNLFSTDSAKWASIGGYLPLFGMTGVIGFLGTRKKHWATRLTLFCTFCAFIPIFNSAFYAFNGSYYARWFYMPILIMAMMTAIAMDDVQISLKQGIWISGGVLLFCLAACFIPIKDGEDIKWFDFANYPIYFVLILALCVLNLCGVVWLAVCRRRGEPVLRRAMALTIGACVLCTASVVYFGVSLGPIPRTYARIGIEGGEKISLPDPREQFYRIDISEDYDNYPMFWGCSNMRAFQSVVPVSIMEFYDQVGVTRDVASRAPIEHYTLRGLFSVRYYFDKVNNAKKDEYSFDCGLPGFEYVGIQNEFYVYENQYYIPMGFTYDSYVSQEDVEGRSGMSCEKVLINSIVLNQEQIQKYGSLMKPVLQNNAYGLTEERYLEACRERAEHACDSFRYDSSGFTGTITLEQPNLVFFSVPYEAGWSVTVNGQPVDVERVSYGFMAVEAQAGDNVIVFTYETPGLRIGAWLTGAGALLLVLYLLLTRKCRKREAKQECFHTCWYGYDLQQDVPAAMQYAAYLSRYAGRWNEEGEKSEDASERRDDQK